MALTAGLGWSAAHADSASTTASPTAQVTPSAQPNVDASAGTTTSEKGHTAAVAPPADTSASPHSVTSASPPDGRVLLELTGEVSIPQDQPWSQVKLATATGNYRLIGVDKDVNSGVIRSGDTITVTALTSPDGTATNHLGRLIEAAVPSGHATEIRHRAEPSVRTMAESTVETHNVTLVRATWAGVPIDGAPSLAEGRAALVEAGDYWRGQSANAIDMVNVAEQDNVTLSTSVCDVNADPLAEVQAELGWQPWTSAHIVLLIPECSGGLDGTYGWANQGWARTYGGYVVMNGPKSVAAGPQGYRGGVLAHELGHNLSLGHSQEVICEGGSTAKVPNAAPASCVNNPYRGAYSVMGNTWLGYAPPALTGNESFILGLTGPNSLKSIAVADGKTQKVTLSPVGPGNGLRFLSVADNEGNTYHLEYRTAAGQDRAYLSAPGNRGAPSGLIVTKSFAQQKALFNEASPDATANFVDSSDTYLLDAQPNVNPFSADPWTSGQFEGDPVVKPSQALTLNNINVTLNSTTLTAATVTIVYNPLPDAPTAPSPPRSVIAEQRTGGVAVSWDSPESNGGDTITEYTVTASPGGATCTSPGTNRCMVTGLTVGETYTFTVTATNSAGVSAASEPSNQVTVEPDPTPTPTETPTPVVTDTYVPIDYPTYVDSTTSDTLARTGAFDIKAFVLAGVGSIAVGTLLLTLSRRRRRGQHESR